MTFLSDNGSPMVIKMTAEGPVIEMNAPKVVFKNTGCLSLEAKTIEMKTSGNMNMDIGGTCSQRIAGNMNLDVRDDIHMKAQAGSIDAVRGGFSVSATDDLDLKGLRILHNVPHEEEVLEQLEKARTFGEFMKCSAHNPNGPKKLKPGEPVERKDW
ncbi:MAG: hypothetical protein CSA81_05890 [Acidobacteria bacterium]|nr:MAG: hypothetical protein CSA81_05890 [Acidobacteriota bacterium]